MDTQFIITCITFPIGFYDKIWEVLYEFANSHESIITNHSLYYKNYIISWELLSPTEIQIIHRKNESLNHIITNAEEYFQTIMELSVLQHTLEFTSNMENYFDYLDYSIPENIDEIYDTQHSTPSYENEMFEYYEMDDMLGSLSDMKISSQKQI